MIKYLNLELAIARREYKNKSTINNTSTFYEIVTKRIEVEDFNINIQYLTNSAFIHALTLTEEKRRLLSIVYSALSETIEDILPISGSIYFSYAYFSFVDENEAIVFSSPYQTSPVIFNPNDIDGNYKVVASRKQFNQLIWPDNIKSSSNNLRRILKHVCLDIANAELGIPLPPDTKVNTPVVYTVSNIVNSLFNYFYNSANSQTVSNIKSVYEEPTNMPSIRSMSTYNLTQFVYQPTQNESSI